MTLPNNVGDNAANGTNVGDNVANVANVTNVGDNVANVTNVTNVPTHDTSPRRYVTHRGYMTPCYYVTRAVTSHFRLARWKEVHGELRVRRILNCY